MDSLQAKQMLKQIDCHGIPRGYNGGYSELYKYCLESINKLEQIEQIVDDCDSGMISCEQLFLNLRTILEQE
jgi:hypothetical protein